MQYSRGEPIEARVNTLRRLARWASTAIQAWELIEASIEDESSMDLLEPYRPYFVVSAHGHRELGLLYLHAIFENRNDTVNVNAVCKHLREHGVDVSAIQADIQNHRASLKKLSAIRSAAIGHRTSAQSYDATFAKFPMTLDELDSLLALATRCGSALSQAINLPPEPLMIDPVDPLAKLLKALGDVERERQASNPWN